MGPEQKLTDVPPSTCNYERHTSLLRLPSCLVCLRYTGLQKHYSGSCQYSDEAESQVISPSQRVSHALTSALVRSHSPAPSLGPFSPRSLRPTLPKGRPTNQQRKSRAKKIKGIRRALLPLTYILPSARGGPAADGSCSAGGDTGLTARPACHRPSGGATAPKLRAGPVPAAAARSRLPPQRDRPLPGAGGGGKFLRGGARRAPLPLRRNHRLRGGRKEERKEGGREGGGHPGCHSMAVHINYSLSSTAISCTGGVSGNE
ncbi:uncharacterized protein LOC120497873 [Passer montanus]|uniref:uncharacterized protein LOC120497873 n=1 Tax=Passer montanus TaxID=9160 RepID=UPI00195FEDB8|nr:uncharacterized protein LOC120497873 [Passer montanus]